MQHAAEDILRRMLATVRTLQELVSHALGGLKMEITRSGILRDCLEEKNREMHKYSKHEAGLEPLPGYEQHFEDLRKTC